ncbi:acylphosphatase [Thermospira aquatica]|uniref:acylphosphatase n=1 Tax=Thermospira aquatica TaxID=2828656 RepID=A0AAX3BCD4_9SPIR|nr:acylphosphatase [Thermospira aquatica]URA09806.1 acylphosphatase [Thermospira aquatica]
MFYQLEAIISGRVQGVGFRFFAKRMAMMLQVTGWVCNMPNGSVKVVAVGTKEQIAEFLMVLSQGPSMAEVEDVKHTITESEWNPYNDFDIRYGCEEEA